MGAFAVGITSEDVSLSVSASSATDTANTTTELVEAWLPVILLITVVSFVIAAFKWGMGGRK